MASGDPAALLILHQALASPFGVALETTDPLKAKAHLYKARAEARQPALQCLQIRQGPEGEIWLVKGPGAPV